MNKSPLQQYAEDHRYLLDLVARQGGLAEPVAIDLASANGTFLVDGSARTLTRSRVCRLDGGQAVALASRATVITWHPAA